MPFNKHLNKELYQITKEDLDEFFSEEVQETSTLELKGGEVDIIKIYREICAFLNTEGGTLIIGSPKEVEIEENGITKKVYSGELVPSSFKSKDWLTQKISSYIVPAPIEIKIHEVPYGEGKVFLLQVPKSSTPPHQDTTSGKYYIRMEGEAKAAPHGIVEALFNQVKSANLALYLDIERINNSLFKIVAEIENEELRPAENIIVYISAIGKINIIEDQLDVSVINKENGNRIINKITKFDKSLVAGVGSNSTLDIRAFGEGFKVLIAYWCKNKDVQYGAVEYDISKDEITRQGSTKTNNVELIEVVTMKSDSLVRLGEATN